MPGMEGYLKRQFKSHVMREDLNLRQENLGKLNAHKATLENKIKPNFAYVDEGTATDVIKRHNSVSSISSS